MRKIHEDCDEKKQDLLLRPAWEIIRQNQRTSVTGALRVTTLAQPALASASTSWSSAGGTHDTLPIMARPATTRSLTLRTRPCPVGSLTLGDTCNVGRNCVVRSRNPPSKAASSSARAGAFFVDPSKTRCESGGLAENETFRAALLVCA
jgi:hypothetical protein